MNLQSIHLQTEKLMIIVNARAESLQDQMDKIVERMTKKV
jgi:hypothetical protein